MKKVIKPPIKPTKKQNVKPVKPVKPTKKQNVKPIKPVKPTKKQNVKPIKPVKIAKLKIAIGKITAQLIKNNPKLLRGGSGITDLLFNKKLMRGGDLTDRQKKDIEDFLKNNAKNVHELKEEFVDDVIINMYENRAQHGNEDAAGNGYDIFYDNFTQGNVYDYKTDTLNRFFRRKGEPTDTKIEKSETLAILKIIETFANMQEIDKTTGIKQYKIKVRDEKAVKAFKNGKVQEREDGGKELKNYVEDLKKAREQVKAAEIKVDNTEGDGGELEGDGRRIEGLEREGGLEDKVLEGRLRDDDEVEEDELEDRMIRERRGNERRGNERRGNERRGNGDTERRAATFNGRERPGADVPYRSSASVGRPARITEPFLLRDGLGDGMRREGRRGEGRRGEGLGDTDEVEEVGLREREGEVGNIAPVVPVERGAGDKEVRDNLIMILKEEYDKNENITDFFLDFLDIITDVAPWNEEERKLIYAPRKNLDNEGEDINLTETQENLLKTINNMIPEFNKVMLERDKSLSNYKNDDGDISIENTILENDKIKQDTISLKTVNISYTALCVKYRDYVNEFMNIFRKEQILTASLRYDPATYKNTGEKKEFTIPYFQDELGGGAPVKYKSTGQVVFILYKKKKYKRTIFVKDKRKTRYCKINNEYILLSKLKVIE